MQVPQEATAPLPAAPAGDTAIVSATAAVDATPVVDDTASVDIDTAAVVTEVLEIVVSEVCA